MRRLRTRPAAEHWSLLDLRPDGRPVVIAFSTASCAECSVQDAVLRRVAGLRVLRVDAHRRPDLAGRFGVLTVPTTVVLDRDGSVAAINHGLADAGTLQAQATSG